MEIDINKSAKYYHTCVSKWPATHFWLGKDGEWRGCSSVDPRKGLELKKNENYEEEYRSFKADPVNKIPYLTYKTLNVELEH